MSLNNTVDYILSEISYIDIIDAHEHLEPEKERIKLKLDVCNLFSHYTKYDLLSAGMTEEEYNQMINPGLPLDKRYSLLKKYLPYIKHSSYTRALFIALRDIYGYSDITDENYKEISRRRQELNRPGIYDEILVKRCRARAVLTQVSRTDYDKRYMLPVLWIDVLIGIRSREDVEKRATELNMEIRNLEDYLQWMEERILKWSKYNRVVGIKCVSLPRNMPPSRDVAEKAFNNLMRESAKEEDFNILNLFLFDKVLELCEKLDLTVAVHSGVWGDFRRLDPRHMIPYFQRHANTRFDLYHMGMPWIRDAAFIAKNFPNVYLNLCWSHIVSPYMVRSSLPEYIDVVPINKIIAFGGDYRGVALEKVWGHLVMAKENIACALAKLVLDGRMRRDEAVDIAKMWFYENPVRIYKLKEKRLI